PAATSGAVPASSLFSRAIGAAAAIIGCDGAGGRTRHATPRPSSGRLAISVFGRERDIPTDAMSALLPKADMCAAQAPIADLCTAANSVAIRSPHPHG